MGHYTSLGIENTLVANGQALTNRIITLRSQSVIPVFAFRRVVLPANAGDDSRNFVTWSGLGTVSDNDEHAIDYEPLGHAMVLILDSLGGTFQDGCMFVTSEELSSMALVEPYDILLEGNVRIDASTGDVDLEASQNAFMDGSQKSSTSKIWYGKKKSRTTTNIFNNNAVTTDIQSNNISLIADGSINLTAGKILNLYAIEDVNKSSTEIKKRSSWLGVRYDKDNTSDTRQELSQLPVKLIGGKAYTASGGSTLLEGTVFKTLKPADIKVGVGKYADNTAQVILVPITNQINTTHNQEKESTVWQKTVEERDTVTTAQLPKFNQTPTITSPNGVVIGVPIDVDISENNAAKLKIQKSQEELGKIALNLSKQPGYEYLAELDKKNEINWVQVQLIQEHFKFEQEGLTPAGIALLTLAVAWAAGPAATSISASFGGGALGTAAGAGFMSLSNQAAIAFTNNQGDISKTLNDLTSSKVVRTTLTAALTAGALDYVNTSIMPDVFKNLSIEGAKSLKGRLVNSVFESTTSSLIVTGINGGSLSDNLKFALISNGVDAAQGFSASEIKLALNSDILRVISQAAAGCAAAELKGSECAAGLIGAGAGEIAADILLKGRNPTFISAKELNDILALSKFVAGVSAAFGGYDVNTAIGVANTTVLNNGLKDKAVLKMEKSRQYLDSKGKQALDGLIKAYKNGDIKLAQQYKNQLDDSIAAWATSGGGYSVLGIDGKAAVGAAIFAVSELAIPTNVTEVIPIGRLSKATKAFNNLNPGTIKILDKATPDENELKAGYSLAQAGYNVQHLPTASQLGIQKVRTADTYVEGLGRIDVYTPETDKIDNILRSIEKKSSQANGVLIQKNLSSSDMSSMASRMWNKTNAKNINIIIFQDSNGKIIKFKRP